MGAAQVVGTLEELVMGIFALLPSKTLARCKAVCRTWEKLIADPYFTRAAYSCVPYTTSFTITSDPSSTNGIQRFVPMHKKTANLPSTVTRLLSKKFRVLDSSHGLLCLRRDEVLLVGNPITSSWAEIPKLPESPEPYHFAGATVLSFDPASSSDYFYVLIPVLLHYGDDNKIYDLRFHVFSSETWSWKLSAAKTLMWKDDRPWDARLTRFVAGPRGGSVCWMQGDDLLMGYEISNNSQGDGVFWNIPLPKGPQKGVVTKWILNGYDGDIYHLVKIREKLTMWRLEGKGTWVFEGEWQSERFGGHVVVPFAVDRARGMLFVKGGILNELVAFHLVNSRWETICKDASIVSVFRVVPYAASDVSFAGGIEGEEAIERLLSGRSRARVELN